MAYFECVYGAAIGFSIPLVVTCSDDFAGLTITCTDGNTTLTDTCPSSSPYEVTFELPNTGTWTVSTSYNGQTISESVLVDEFDVELSTIKNITVDFYSAANDTVSYTGIDNQTHTITTDSNGHATATISIDIVNGSSLTFTSSVAKNPTALSSYYTKTISLDANTTSVYVMPDNTLYWYGCKVNIETCNTSNGWSYSSGWTWQTPTYNTNYVSLSASSGSYTVGIGAKTSVNTKTLKAIAQGIRVVSGNTFYYDYGGRNQKSGYTDQGWTPKKHNNTSIATVTDTVTNTVDTFPIIHTIANGAVNVYALWYE